MTRETFSRTLGAIARHGLRVDGDSVIVDDPRRPCALPSSIR